MTPGKVVLSRLLLASTELRAIDLEADEQFHVPGASAMKPLAKDLVQAPEPEPEPVESQPVGRTTHARHSHFVLLSASFQSKKSYPRQSST